MTQGRCSPNLYSLYVSDMRESMSDLGTTDCMDTLNLAQIADEYLESMKKKLTAIFTINKFQFINTKKTFCNFSENPTTQPLRLDNNIHIQM